MTDIDEMAAEIVRLRKEREWRDISTAPKDGTEIIIAGRDWVAIGFDAVLFNVFVACEL